jgi:sugar/nucleoside kinase (ribokinase family)
VSFQTRFGQDAFKTAMKRTEANCRRGLLAGGNWVLDQIKVIDVYPQPERLANIRWQSNAVGGSPANILICLARSGVRFPLEGAGFVGNDKAGSYVIQECRRHGVSVRHLTRTSRAATSFTDVMTEEAQGRRTFFHDRGANALWKGAGLDFTRTRAKIFHLGQLLLLDSLDAPDARYGTRAARLLAKARRAGLKTSIDVVSEEGDRFASVVIPALKEVDYCILNEIEAGKTTGTEMRLPDGRADAAALPRAADALFEHGVHELVVIHLPEGAFARTREGESLWQPSLKLSADYIRGTVGAGDAFCAGMLLGLHEDWNLDRSLLTATCLAAACLSDATATGGIRSLSASLALARRFGFNSSLTGRLRQIPQSA